MLVLHDVTVCFSHRPALQEVSLTFPPGKVVAVIGPNGSGKSTLLRAAAGIQPISAGRILLDDFALQTLRPRQIAQKVSYLPQDRTVPGITAWRLVLHGRFPHLSYPRRIGEEDKRIATRALETVGGLDLAPRMMQGLSGGQRQKVYIAMALAQETDTILLDEPTTYLDISHQMQVMELTRRLASQGKAVGIVLHDLALALEYADRVAVLQGGRLAAVGSGKEMYESGVPEQIFGVKMDLLYRNGRWRYLCTGAADREADRQDGNTE